MLISAIIFMNLALVCYTWAVFSGRAHGLHRRHMIVFGTGLVFDFFGTHHMNIFAMTHGKAPQAHNITGIASLAGMSIHFLLALIASLAGKTEVVNKVFHRISLTIYSCWLFAFITGALFGMVQLK